MDTKCLRVHFDTNLKKFVLDGKVYEIEEIEPTISWDDTTTTYFCEGYISQEVVDAKWNIPEKLKDVKICKDCGRAFWQTENDISFFKNKGLIPPKRCIRCRKKRKAAQSVVED